MTQLRMFAVYDSKAQLYLQPFCVKNVGEAVRAFAHEANQPDSLIGRFAADYTLFEIGSFDDESGMPACAPNAINHGQASSFLRPTEPRPTTLEIFEKDA